MVIIPATNSTCRRRLDRGHRFAFRDGRGAERRRFYHQQMDGDIFVSAKAQQRNGDHNLLANANGGVTVYIYITIYNCFLTNNNREFTNNLGNLVGRYQQDFGFLAMTCERGRYHNAGIKTGKLDARILPFRHFQAHALIFKRSMFHCYQNKTKTKSAFHV